MSAVSIRRPSPPVHVRARSGDARFLRMLRDGSFQGRVHSAFERVVNLERAGGGLFTLAARDVDDAPHTLVLDLPGFGDSGVEAGERVTAIGGTLAIAGRIAVDIDTATAWDPTLPPWPDDHTTVAANVALVRTRGDTLGSAVDERSAFAAEVTAMLEQRADALRAALLCGDAEAAVRHGIDMLGLGPGLTPSGDDFLLGLLAALHVPQGPAGRLAAIGAAIAAAAPRRTHAISVAALEAAATGRVRASIHAFVRALMHGRRECLQAALDDVLAIGSTSGADIVSGVLCGFEVHLQLGGSVQCQ